MRSRIGQIAAGRFTGTKPILAFSEESIDLSVIEDKDETGSFVIDSTDQIKIRGIVYSTNPRMECLNPHFEGEKVRIRYQFYSRGLKEGDTSEGHFVIVCNQIEYSLSFCVKITRLYAESSVGIVKNTDDFTKLAKNNWNEAYHLFYNRNFFNILSKEQVTERLTYQGIAAAKPSSQNMEEFLIGIHKKQPVSISVNKTEDVFERSTEDQRGSFEITRENWGYTEIRVRTDCDFIKLSKPVLNLEDFIGKTYIYDYIIDRASMHAGKNFGRIYIEGVYQMFTIDVTADVSENEGCSDISRKDIKECKAGLLELYINYRLKHIVTGVWANESISIINHLHALEPDNAMYLLMKAQAYIINRQRQDAEWILDDFKRNYADKKDPLWGYYLYLMTLMEREPAYVDKMTHEIELIFYANPDNSLLFWVLLFLREQYFDNNSGKLKDIKYWALKGCTSPYLYVEAFYLIWKDPYLLKELGTFEIRLLRWAIKENALNCELAQQIFEVVELSRGFDKVVFDILTAAYDVCPEPENVGIICSYLIKCQQNDTKYHKWFEKGIELELRITGLYEAFLITFDDRQISEVPQIIQLYFQYDNRLPYRKLAVLYNNIIAAKDKEPEVYHKYRKTMGRFAMEQAEFSHMDDNLAVLYEDMIDLGFINAELAHALSNIIFSHKIIVFDKHVVRAIIYQSRMKEPQIVPVIDQTAYFQLFSDEYVVLFEDERGYRYVDSISYRLQRLMDSEKYLDRCIELAPDEIPYIISHFKKLDNHAQFTKADSRFFKYIICDKSISDEYRAKMAPEILKFYQIHENEDETKAFLQSIDFKILSSAARRSLMDMLVWNRLYEKACDMAMEYGIDQLGPAAKVTLCENVIATGMCDEDFTEKLAVSAFIAGKYNDSILEYLCRLYSGPTDTMIDLWQAADKFGIASINLEERILEQSIYTDKDLCGISDIFERYYKIAGNEMLILAYITSLAHSYLFDAAEKAGFIFDIIENRYINKRTSNDACQLALLKYLSTKSDITESEYRIEDELLEYYIYHNMNFDFFASLDHRLVQKYHLYDKMFLQYKAKPKSHVVLHYSRDEDGDDFTAEDMTEVYDGIYVKTFVMFFGEMIRYYITEEDDNKVDVKESNRLTFSNVYGDGDHSRYNLINEMIISNTLAEDESLFDNIREYEKYDNLTKQIFKLM